MEALKAEVSRLKAEESKQREAYVETLKSAEAHANAARVESEARAVAEAVAALDTEWETRMDKAKHAQDAARLELEMELTKSKERIATLEHEAAKHRRTPRSMGPSRSFAELLVRRNIVEKQRGATNQSEALFRQATRHKVLSMSPLRQQAATAQTPHWPLLRQGHQRGILLLYKYPMVIQVCMPLLQQHRP